MAGNQIVDAQLEDGPTTGKMFKQQPRTDLLGMTPCAMYDFRGLDPLACRRVLARADPYQMATWSQESNLP